MSRLAGMHAGLNATLPLLSLRPDERARPRGGRGRVPRRPGAQAVAAVRLRSCAKRRGAARAGARSAADLEHRNQLRAAAAAEPAGRLDPPPRQARGRDPAVGLARPHAHPPCRALARADHRRCDRQRGRSPPLRRGRRFPAFPRRRLQLVRVQPGRCGDRRRSGRAALRLVFRGPRRKSALIQALIPPGSTGFASSTCRRPSCAFRARSSSSRRTNVTKALIFWTMLAATAALATAGLSETARTGAVSDFTLDNGLEVVVIPDHRTPVVTHMIWYRVGSADETPGKSGLAHFLEHLMFKGTTKNPLGKFTRTVSTLGGHENAFTTSDYTAYFQRSPRARLRTLMEFESDRMTGLVL